MRIADISYFPTRASQPPITLATHLATTVISAECKIQHATRNADHANYEYIPVYENTRSKTTHTKPAVLTSVHVSRI